MELSKVWLEESGRQRKSLLRAAQPSALSVTPSSVQLRRIVRGDVFYRVFTVVNRGTGPARFKAFFRKPHPHTRAASHGLVHYSPAGVTAFPAIPATFTVEFHANAAGEFRNTLVLMSEAQNIEVPFEINVVEPVRFLPCFLG